MATKKRFYIVVNMTNKEGWSKMFDCREMRCDDNGIVTLVLLDGTVETFDYTEYHYFSPFIYKEEKEVE